MGSCVHISTMEGRIVLGVVVAAILVFGANGAPAKCKKGEVLNSSGKCENGEAFVMRGLENALKGKYDDLKKQVVAARGSDMEGNVHTFFQQAEIIVGQTQQLVRREGRKLTLDDLEDINLGKYIDELKDDLQNKKRHLDMKKDMNAILAATQKAMSAMSQYFTKLAQHDIAVGNADIGFIKSELDRMAKGGTELFGEIKKNLRSVLKQAVIALGAEVAERVADVALNVGQCFNPFAVVFGGCDAATIKASIEALGDATKRLTKATSLQKMLGDLFSKVGDVFDGYKKNAAQYAFMESLVKTITKDPEQVKPMADTFLKMYSDYTPAVNSQQLAYVLALFGHIVDSACDLRDGASGAVVNVGQTVKAAFPDECDKLPALMAKFESYHEELYDFQFDFVDAITGYVRAQVAKAYAADMKQKQNKLDKSGMAVGLVMDMVRIQKVGIIYCNYLEYMKGGERPEQCKTKHFTDDHINKLIATRLPSGGDPTDVLASVPTSPRKKGDIDEKDPIKGKAAFVDLKELMNKRKVYFQLPMKNPDFIVDNEWVFDSDELEDYSMFIKKFEMFLPFLAKNKKCQYTVQALFYSSKSNKILPYDTAVSYEIGKMKWKFQYDENVEKKDCRGTPDTNPVTDNPICITSRGIAPGLDDKIPAPPPSLYTNWQVKLKMRAKGKDCDPIGPEEIEKIGKIKIRAVIEQIEPDEIDNCWLNPCEGGKKCSKRGKTFKCT